MRQGVSRLGLPLVLIAFCFPLFLGLASADLDNDEAIYAYAAESIVNTGRWMSPLSSPTTDVVFLEKPHLKFWIVAAPIRWGLLPYDEFGLRVWDAVFGAAAFLYVFLIGRRLAGPLCGIVAVLTLFAHRPLLFEHGLRTTNMEAALVLTYCGGVYHYLRWADGGRERAGHIAAIGAWFVLGFMTKFVAALFLPAVLAVSALSIGQHRRQLLADRWRLLYASIAVAGAIVPWFAYQHVVHGARLWGVMFGEHVFTRFTAFADASHLQPWHFYVTTGYGALVDANSAIWVGLGLAVLLVESIRRRHAAGIVILIWLTLPLVLISLGTSKLYHYFYPFLPPVALAAGFGVAWLARHAARLTAPVWVRPDTFMASVSPRVKNAAVAVMAAALALALWTAIAGTARLAVGGHVLLRNGSIMRPLVVAILCAVVAGGLRTAVAAAFVLALSSIIPTPLTAYSENLGLLRLGHRPLGRLADCVRGVNETRRRNGEQPPAGYSPVSTGFLHPYFYYLRGTGWLDPAVDDARLRGSLFVAGQEAPVVIDKARYSAFLERAARHDRLPPAVSRPHVLVLLPGPYGVCAATQVEPRRWH